MSLMSKKDVILYTQTKYLSPRMLPKHKTYFPKTPPKSQWISHLICSSRFCCQLTNVVDFKLFLTIKEAATAAVMSATTTQDNEEIVVLILGTWLSQ